MSKLNFLVFVLLGVLVANSLHGEDLTTLDGRKYSNISDILKYPKQIFFNFNGIRTNVSVTNIPDEFRSRHGIIVKTNNPVVVTKLSQLDSSDVVLWQNRKSSLYQEEKESSYGSDTLTYTNKDYYLRLESVEVKLTVNTTWGWRNSKLKSFYNSELMHFDIGQEEFMSKVFEKFIEWDKIATTNQAEEFEKEIVRRPIKKSEDDLTNRNYADRCVYYFIWRNGKAELKVEDTTQYCQYCGNFDSEDIIHLQSLLKLLPNMKEKLVLAIQNKDFQKDLFK